MPEFLLNERQTYFINQLVVKLPELRKRVRLSQGDLGDRIGKSRQKISDIERLSAPMGWDTYLAICLVLEMAGAFDEFDDKWYYEAKSKWFK